jgi:hypothetical protein
MKKMKKYILLSITAAFVFAGCVKDEMPKPGDPTPPPVQHYEDIVINELITKDITDPYFVSGPAPGEGTDWVELYNDGNSNVNVADMWITDKPGEEAEYVQIPNTDANITTIPPHGFLVLIMGATDLDGADIITSIINENVFIDFGLSATNDNFVAIYDPEKVEIDISDDFNGLEEDKSFGRTVDAGLEWATLSAKTPGEPNDGSIPVTGTLVINEFMASNDSWPIDDEDPSAPFPDWIEVYNTGDTPIDMGGWYASDDLTDLVLWQLPTGDPSLTTIPAHGYLVLICDGLDNGGLHTNFKLGSGGEDVVISIDGTSVTDGGSYCDSGCDLDNPGTDNSSGRDGDGEATWYVYLMGSSREPSPGTANN